MRFTAEDNYALHRWAETELPKLLDNGAVLEVWLPQPSKGGRMLPVLYNEIDRWMFEKFACIVDAQGYVRAGKEYAHHRILPRKPRMAVDHRDENKLNLTRENLQYLPSGENTRKSSRNRSTGERCIYARKGGFEVNLQTKGIKHREQFKLKADAIAFRDALDSERRLQDFRETGYVEIKVAMAPCPTLDELLDE